MQLIGPLVHERDLYLAWSLKRSKAVNGARRVVGVVGKGHLRGICYALTHDAGELSRSSAGAGRAGRAAGCLRLRRVGASPSCSNLPHYLCRHLQRAAAGAQLRFRDLVGGKNVKADRRKQRAAAVGRFALDTAVFTALWWAWTLLQPQAP